MSEQETKTFELYEVGVWAPFTPCYIIPAPAELKKRRGRPRKQTKGLDGYATSQSPHNRRSRDPTPRAKPRRGRPRKPINQLDATVNGKPSTPAVTCHNAVAHSEAHLPGPKNSDVAHSIHARGR
ncbi:hypothetical protein F5884DRAFT_863602 [Xylogone sp. PMI_703]|nr:hypothetical protein F5884DRAFT_863602 [Xylogone sp. PMI_703]